MKRSNGPDLTEQIIGEFVRLCTIPRGSGNERAVCGYLEQRLLQLALHPKRDAAGNLVADVPACGASPDAPRTILQAHMDMVVAVSNTDVSTSSAVTPIRENGILKSDGRTSLGADNGIGIAVILTLLSRNDFSHGPLRVLFTVSEEVGLKGAMQVPESWLQNASYLINTDGFHSGTALTGCKSGRRETFVRRIHTEPVLGTLTAFRIRLDGFLGGHSGDDIGRGRCNTIQTLAVILRELQRTRKSLRVCSLEGGTGFNAIPAFCEAVGTVNIADSHLLTQSVQEMARPMLIGFHDSGSLSVQNCSLPTVCWSANFQRDTLNFLTELVNGVCDAVPNRQSVSSSCNLGRVFARDGILQVQDMTRCDTDEQEKRIISQHRAAARHCSFIGQVTGYHSWHSDPDCRLDRTVMRIYRELTGQVLERRVAQVGLETAYFQEKAPGLQMVCLGVEIQNAHSVRECVHENSIAILARLIQGVLTILCASGKQP